VEKCD